ncbi:pur operon repressor [Sporolactobacillus spathodeae]|uniref:Purine operon repressor n=1 Tax=Sporolactobacillus spathodeae TaxID=1465502 RepID=A0ABS2QBX7_9BACL|nr:pur operon repressor [Sporolactobacillus spathodeae]MBM7658820.1 purine operon repressor [Sporolactobacillus spathodeae]
MKLRRSSRLVDMTRYLLQHPHQIVPLSHFSERYESAKSSISEDLAIIKENFETLGAGKLQTLAGAAGGVCFVPYMATNEAEQMLQILREKMTEPERILPGGYLYMTDILGKPDYVNAIGRLIASVYADRQIDAIMTMETKGIPIAYAVATQFSAPVVIVRRSSKVTEGSTVSINYISGSSKRIQTMVLPRRSLKENARVLIVDDFMKAGGTMKGMMNLTKEFGASVVGMAVFVEKKEEQSKLVSDYTSLLKLTILEQEEQLVIDPGNAVSSLAECSLNI